MTRFTRALMLIAILALLLAACGGSTGTTSSAGDDAGHVKAVKQLQDGLKQLGYYDGAIDGVYGADTTAAVKSFQKDEDITVDGKYGPETHDTMTKAIGEEHAEGVKHLQTDLKGLGYYDGAIDGMYGADTTAAVKKAQADCSITQDGLYGPDTHNCLVDLTGDA